MKLIEEIKELIEYHLWIYLEVFLGLSFFNLLIGSLLNQYSEYLRNILGECSL